jgi:Fur family peroxide stress response transcriptional regulator
MVFQRDNCTACGTLFMEKGYPQIMIEDKLASPKDPNSRYEELVDKLRELEYRLTPQRLALLRLLAASDGHPSASQLYDQIREQFPTTSLATVYKTLNVLKNMDEVLELGFSNGDTRYDGNKPYAHPHVVCIRCQKILDADVSLAHHLTQEVAQLSGYQIVSHRLDFYVLCPDCKIDP